MMTTRKMIFPILLALSGLACETYNAPPEARLEPAVTVFKTGDVIDILFSEPVDPKTLSIRIWEGPRNLEGEVMQDVEPLLSSCLPQDLCSLKGRRAHRL